MNYLLLFVSVTVDALKNVYTGKAGQNYLKNDRDSLLFNAVISFAAVAFLLPFFLFSASLSTETLFLSLIFAVLSAGAQYYTLRSISSGPVSYSVLFAYLGGILISSFYDVIFSGATLGVTKIVGIVLMVLSVVFGVNLKKEGGMTVRWLIFTALAFVLQGSVGICQEVQQKSEHSSELYGFLFLSFVFMTLLFFGLSRILGKQEQHYFVKSKDTPAVLVVGLFVGAINFINLYLVGRMQSFIFFPIVNGGVIVISALLGFLILKERMTKSQLVGIVLGVASSVLLCL